MELAFPDRFVLLDTEYTAWEGSQARKWSGPNEYREIIQVGMIRVGPGLVEEADLKLFVKPIKNPVLSDYIKDLTHITQEEVDAGVTLEECVHQTKAFLAEDPAYSYGLDEVVMSNNCGLIGVPYELGLGRIADVRPLIFPSLAALNIDPTGYTSGTLISAFGPAPLRAHDAVNDMRNLLDAITHIQSRTA